MAMADELRRKEKQSGLFCSTSICAYRLKKRTENLTNSLLPACESDYVCVCAHELITTQLQPSNIVNNVVLNHFVLSETLCK
jgi:hypothetical protein